MWGLPLLSSPPSLDSRLVSLFAVASSLPVRHHYCRRASGTGHLHLMADGARKGEREERRIGARFGGRAVSIIPNNIRRIAPILK